MVGHARGQGRKPRQLNQAAAVHDKPDQTDPRSFRPYPRRIRISAPATAKLARADSFGKRATIECDDNR